MSIRADAAHRLSFALLALCWGSSFFLYKVLDAAMCPALVVSGRLVVGALFLNVVLLLLGVTTMPLLKRWHDFLNLTTFNNAIPFWLVAWSELHFSSGLAAVLNATAPLFLLLSNPANFRPPGKSIRKSSAIVIGFAGLVVLTIPSMWHGDVAQMPAIGAGLLAVSCYVFSTLFGRRFNALPPMQVAAGQVTAASLVSLPFGVISLVATHPHLSPHEWVVMAGIGIICTGLAYMLFFRLLARSGSVNVQMVTLAVPLVGLALGHLALGEMISAATRSGAILVCVALTLACAPAVFPRRWHPID